MKHIGKQVLLLAALTPLLTGCSVAATDEKDTYTTITGETAKEMMDENDDAVILDVRTQEEYEEGHIEGAVLIPDYEIEDKAGEMLPDKGTTILVYCRSGRRSAAASSSLYNLGYTNVYDFGGIIDWPYKVVKE